MATRRIQFSCFAAGTRTRPRPPFNEAAYEKTLRGCEGCASDILQVHRGRLDLAKKSGEGGAEGVVIKKYANRRLYNTSTSAYVTLEDLSQMVHEGVDFVVKDAKTGDDITRTVLGQIIFEQESHGENLLPVQFLRQLIRFYGDSMKTFLPSYLEMSIEAFAKQQEAMQKQFTGAVGGANAYSVFEEMTRQNMAIFQDAMRMFLPTAGRPLTPTSPAADAGQAPSGSDIESLRREMEAMRARLDKLSGG
jgi:polyhydroxyalkanoate synthesis repressor PhaR